MSPTSRGRGLKYSFFFVLLFFYFVALFTRAWIEIEQKKLAEQSAEVALFTRAWIEIRYSRPPIRAGRKVALFTRAWIEIGITVRRRYCGIGRPLHEGVD